MRQAVTITQSTPLSLVLANAGVPLHPPTVLGRKSWLNAQTCAQLPAELRTAAREQAASRHWQVPSAAEDLLSAFMRLNLQDPAADPAAHQNLKDAVAKVRQQAELGARARQDALQREKDAQKAAQLAALATLIATLAVAIQRALSMGDLITAAILAAALLVLQIEFAKIAAS
jgi:hypothetical protein